MTTEQKFNCIFCKDVFDNKAELQVHFRKHADPEFKSKSRFMSDPQVSDEKAKEKSDMVGCDVCSQMFPTISKAITHKHKVHPDHDVKYFCPWCGKLFTMKHPYNIHVQTSHENPEHIENKTFHCDCCDVDFFLPLAMIYHNRFFHRQDTDIPDVGISKKLKLYNQEAIQLYYCAFCGEEFESKVNLFKHITDDHSDENQSPEEVLRCPLCEAIFYHLDAYEIHLSFHTADDLYSTQNDLIAGILDFSLETVPPMIEKVENRDYEAEVHSQGSDTELNESAVGIEKFLELAMDQPEDSNSGKVKKKKHKKSKKSAITLDEFLSMNQDVFGEDLDFQGVEELPTRVVKKRVRNNKKAVNAAASAELEKLKQKGIVVVKVDSPKTSKASQKKVAKKPSTIKELRTSSEVLTKLMNQSNNQIKIVKKTNLIKNEAGQDSKVTSMEQNTSVPNEKEITNNQCEEDTEISNLHEAEVTCRKKDNSPLADSKNIPSPKPKDIIPPNPNTVTGINQNTEYEQSKNTMIPKEPNRTSINNANSENTLKGAADNSQKLDELESLNPSNAKHLYGPQSDCEEEANTEMFDSYNGTDTEDIEDSNEDINKIQSSSHKNNGEPNIKQIAGSLSTLKHLSHITVKPINQIPPEPATEKVLDLKNNDSPQTKIDKEQSGLTALQAIQDKDSSLDALKILSKNITIRSLSVSTNKNVEPISDDKAQETRPKVANSVKLKTVTENKNLTIKKLKIETDEPVPTTKVINMVNKPSQNPQPVRPTNRVTTTPSLETQSDKNVEETSLNSPSKANILKHLPNITTKPLPSKKTVQSQVKQPGPSIKMQNVQEIIEISDIDDSDNETDYCIEPEPKQDTSTSGDTLKNLSKSITVKSLNQPAYSISTNIKIERVEEQTDEEDIDYLLKYDTDKPKLCSQKLSSKNIALKNALKNLGKNITVKSGTSSPCQSNKSQDHYSYDSDIDINKTADDVNSEIGRVKITELEGADDFNHENFDENCDLEHSDNQPIVESPHDSCSENDEVHDKLLDFEQEINASAVIKREITSDKNTLCLNNLKNVSKSLTIKSIHTNSAERQEKSKHTLPQESVGPIKNQTKQIPINTAKPSVKESSNDCTSTNRNLTNVSNAIDHSSNESSNQKVSVNKEVLVKTFQTKTVIQEITTTVTKTIKTVNQTVKQETRNANQMSVPVMPQKVIGMRPSTSKNLQGVVIRQAAPTVVRPNNSMGHVRPAATVVRPRKPIVPTRPGLNVIRPNTPRMPNTKATKSSPNKPVIGKPLKFSPSAMASTIVKRPNTDEATGPFSCFKKPKESLIPVSDIPAFAGSGDATIQVKAAVQSSSIYMSTSKVVKGNSIVTATQVKSEESSMQKLSRLNNTVGIKVKSAQVKQTQVQESETSSKKRTTLEAIQRLQKQGLLVKKPRLDVNEDDDFDHPDDNVGMGFSSDGEQDE